MSGDRRLTLRQIEVVRAVMVAGSIAGAARLLNVAQPGISRTMKHLESVLGIKLFTRQGGRYMPTPEARGIFSQLQDVHKKLDNLQSAITLLERGRDVELAVGSVPSIAHAMVPRAVARLKKRYPDLRLNVELLKIEEAVDYLLLGRGELVCMSYLFDHPSIRFAPLASGTLVCLVERSHPLAACATVSAEQIAQYPLVGIEPTDPYGSILAGIFVAKNLNYDISIRARFGSTVIQLIKQNLGVAVLDSFTVADLGSARDSLVVIPISEETTFETYVAYRADVELSSFAETFVGCLRDEMTAGLHSTKL
ncbi:LysR family transcriptional regulator [Nitratireductor luteus]|uniref:LysR family transcriptional regulator n=1 Tax=Nitratireductor luteus TaxID=2976980 RepID=UPI002240BB26|nr:LysR family transcriptional regulator [Nitratireductor luteus]